MNEKKSLIIANEYKDLYTKLAKSYDRLGSILSLFGFSSNKYRREIINQLHLKSGSSILEIACGTGANFKFMQDVIGEKGRIVGLDITPAMLDKAKEKIKKFKWTNVKLI